LGGNQLDVLTITEKGSPEEIKKRKGVVITARIHPGESNSSFVMKGIIDFITSPESIDAELLRKNFVFKLVPMINVDGVICGNYRCSLSGQDLNRRWKKPDVLLYPEIESIKKLVE
jgi:murein tripeptide amidase MpaA